MAAVSRASEMGPSKVTRAILLTVVAIVFAIPFIAMLEFTLRTASGPGLGNWITLFEGAIEGKRAYRGLMQGAGASLLLAVLTVLVLLVILVPTMILVRLRAPKLERALEFICILPITIPAIVLVVGLAPVYAVIARLVGSAPWTLCFVYGIIAMPYAYRAIQSSMQLVDIRTLSEAARSLGAGWGMVVVNVVMPNIRRGLVTAAIITVAIVLGEYTIAALLGRSVLQTSLVEVSQTDPYAAVIVALLALAFAFIMLLVVGATASSAKRRRR